MFTKSLSKSRFNPLPGIADFWSEFRKPQPYRWVILLASAIPVIIIMMWATAQSVTAPPARPEITWITSFAPDRTDEEIMASNIANQERKDAFAAEQVRIEEEKKQMYRDLGRATGIDVDAMEAEIEAERAAEEAAAAASDAPAGEGDREAPLAD
ncbi:hypothetical protein [Altererythrobacter sp. GH1-8]|uniref:hypothetical protein n=1 Tax=Altererythrobacter sp. GH1-8 TaxID=3349333 RepID=UPI00374C95E4